MLNVNLLIVLKISLSGAKSPTQSSESRKAFRQVGRTLKTVVTWSPRLRAFATFAFSAKAFISAFEKYFSGFAPFNGSPFRYNSLAQY
jgi:hypothetical protein